MTRNLIKRLAIGIVLGALAGCMLGHARARDLDGVHANSPLKSWFDHLASGKGLCCSFADGVSVEDVDWDTGGDNKATQSEGGHYRVRLNGQWIIVPDAAVVTKPNKFGPAIVWPYQDGDGVIFEQQKSVASFRGRDREHLAARDLSLIPPPLRARAICRGASGICAPAPIAGRMLARS